MSSPRLPIPGSDDGAWGDLLNEYLRVAHTEDGSLKNGVVKAPQLGLGSVTAPALGSGAVGTEALADGSISETKLSLEVKSRLGVVDSKADSIHSHEIGDVNELQAKLNTLQDSLNELQRELDSTTVKLTSDQTITGAKAFVNSPTVPEATSDEQTVNKRQMDVALSNKVEGDDERLTNNRTPTVHASSHAIGGIDELTPAAIGAQPAATGTPSGMKFLGDDNTWQTIVRGDEWSARPPLVGDPLQIMARGNYTPFSYPGNPALSYVIATPIFTSIACKIDRAEMHVSTAIEGATIDIALYHWFETDSHEVTKIANLGTVDASSTGTKAVELSPPISINAGRYLVLTQSINGVVVYGVAEPVIASFSNVGSGNNIKRSYGAYQAGPPFNYLSRPTVVLSERINVSAPNISLRRSE